MPKHLPELIDPLLCASKGRHWQGKLAIAGMSRLAGMIRNPGQEVDVDLRFDRDGRTAVVRGTVRGELEVVCQRCLDPLLIVIDQAVSLGLVTSIEEGERLGEDYEPLVLERERIRFADIVEDELILAIPDIPRHEHCHIMYAAPQEKGLERPNPFAVLANLKTET